jgi:hypothetical protein
MKYDIKKLEVKDYEDVIQEVIVYLSKYKMVKSIYQIGGVSAPGISDLDLIIVLNDNAKEFTQIWSDYIKQQSKNSKYIFTHYPFLVNEEIFGNGDFLKIFPVFNLIYISGKEYDITLKYGQYEYISNYLDANLPYWSAEFSKEKNNSIRQNLLRLHSFIYPLTMIKNITNYENDQIQEFISTIKEIRKNIFKLDNTIIENTINSLTDKAKDISIKINSVMSEYIKSKLDNINLDLNISIYDNRYNVSNNKNQRNTYLTTYLLIGVVIYFNQDSFVKKYIQGSININNYESDLIRLEKKVFYRELQDVYEIKIKVFDKYIDWLIDTQLGWGRLSTPLFTSFLSYFTTIPENYDNKLKHFIKMLLSKYRFNKSLKK